MSLDRDLRDALQPLAGDPVADAARVLAALPPMGAVDPAGDQPGPGTPTPGGAWWWGGGLCVLGLLVGAVGGWFAGRPGAGAAAPAVAPAVAPSVPGTPDPAKAEEPKEDPKEPAKGSAPFREVAPAEFANQVLCMAFGPVVIDEPGAGRQELEPGSYMAAAGTSVSTGKSRAGVYVYANDLRVRLDRETQAGVEPQVLALDRGRLWFSNLTRPADVTLRAGSATLQANAAVVQVELDEARLWVGCLEGDAVLRTGDGGTIRLQAAQQVEVRGLRPAGAVTDLPFAGSVTSWMTQMILLQTDDRELRQRVATMVTAFAGETWRNEAAIELRRLGAHSVPRLFDLWQATTDAALQVTAAELLADVAGYAEAEWLFAVLERGEAPSRVVAFRGLQRVTGGAERDEVFWREAGAEARQEAVAAWRQQLR